MNRLARLTPKPLQRRPLLDDLLPTVFRIAAYSVLTGNDVRWDGASKALETAASRLVFNM